MMKLDKDKKNMIKQMLDFFSPDELRYTADVLKRGARIKQKERLEKKNGSKSN